MNVIVRGSIAGTIATGIMTVIIGAGRAAGLLVTPPPREITEKAVKKVGIKPRKIPEPVLNAGWLTAHLGYGAVAGVFFSSCRSLLPENPVAAGALFGGFVWGVSYLGYLPATGLYPPPEHDSNARTAVMIAAHAVYGVSLAEIERLLGTPRREVREQDMPDR